MAAASSSSGKRTFSEVEGSPEEFQNRAKKSSACYRRCFAPPQEPGATGLTGAFATIQLLDAAASGFAGRGFPKRSSPIAVAKSLFGELDEPAEDVFEDGPRDSSFTSPLPGNADLCRSLGLDSDGSGHETSLTADASFESSRRLSGSPEDGSSRPEISFSVAAETPRADGVVQTGRRCSDSNAGGGPPPSFLRPKNVVAFRSYCSSIDRSNTSGLSRLSMALAEDADVSVMDVSAAASCHSFAGNATPVQKRHSSSMSLSQVSRSLPRSGNSCRIPKGLVFSCLLPSDAPAHVDLTNPLQDPQERPEGGPAPGGGSYPGNS